MKIRFLMLLFAVSASIHAQDKRPYQLYDKNGNKTTYLKLLEETQKTQIYQIYLERATAMSTMHDNKEQMDHAKRISRIFR